MFFIYLILVRTLPLSIFLYTTTISSGGQRFFFFLLLEIGRSVVAHLMTVRNAGHFSLTCRKNRVDVTLIIAYYCQTFKAVVDHQ